MTETRSPEKIELCSIGRDAAREIGVCPGMAPKDASMGLKYLMAANRGAGWCAPLVIAGASEVFDFTKGYDPNRQLNAPFGIGRFGEDRIGMYEAPLFKTEADARTIHMGLDIGAPEGTPIFAPLAGDIWGCGILSHDGDYGGTVILRTEGEIPLYMLFGHLSSETAKRWKTGLRVEKGELLGWLGGKHENGGWNPHLHWQISWLEPLKVDFPGAVAKPNEALSRLVFVDPTEFLKASIAGWR